MDRPVFGLPPSVVVTVRPLFPLRRRDLGSFGGERGSSFSSGEVWFLCFFDFVGLGFIFNLNFSSYPSVYCLDTTLADLRARYTPRV